jgi:hypothetical protein
MHYDLLFSANILKQKPLWASWVFFYLQEPIDTSSPIIEIGEHLSLGDVLDPVDTSSGPRTLTDGLCAIGLECDYVDSRVVLKREREDVAVLSEVHLREPCLVRHTLAKSAWPSKGTSSLFTCSSPTASTARRMSSMPLYAYVPVQRGSTIPSGHSFPLFLANRSYITLRTTLFTPSAPINTSHVASVPSSNQSFTGGGGGGGGVVGPPSP